MERKRLKALFAGYCLLMLWLLFGQRLGDSAGMNWQFWLQNSVNWLPGRTIWNLFRGAWNQWHASGGTELLRFAVINNFGNIIMFLPLGFFLPALWRWQRRWRCFLLTVLLIIMLIETVQLLAMLGSWDIDDLLLNLVGAALGCLFYKKRCVSN